MVVILSSVIVGLVHCYIASFVVSFGRLGYGENLFCKFLIGFFYLLDIMLVMDLIIQCYTAFYHPDHGYIKLPKKILLHRLKTASFWMDILAVLPIEVFAPFFKNKWHAVTFLRSNRLIKLGNVSKFFASFEQTINASMAQVRAVKLFIYIIFATHISACVWYLQACYGTSCVKSSWVAYRTYTEAKNLMTYYIEALYWAAATMTSTGYGDIVARSEREQTIVLFELILGLLLFGFCLSSITATLANAQAPKIQFLERIIAVRQFMIEKNLDLKLVDKVQKNFALVWRVHKGQSLPGENDLMLDMPERLQQDVSYEEVKVLLEQVSIFKDTHDSFLRMLSSRTRTYLFTPGDHMVNAGDMGREMYVIRRGYAEALVPDCSSVLATLTPGTYFGEIGLLFGESRSATIRAKTYCEVVMITKNNLDEVLGHFPVISRQFTAIVRNATILQNIKEATKKSFNPTQKESIVSKKRKISEAFRRISKTIRQSKVTPGAPESRKDATADTQRAAVNTVSAKPELRDVYNELQPVFRWLSYLLMRRTIHPHGLFFRIWSAFIVTLVCVFTFILGLQAAFLQKEGFIFGINVMMDAWFLIDMYIMFHVGYYTKDGILVTHPTATAKNYLRTNFILDFIACFPLYSAYASGELSYKFYYCIQLNRLLRMYKVIQFVNYLERPIISTAAKVFKPIGLAVYICLMTHWFACAWFMIACYGDANPGSGSLALGLNGHVSNRTQWSHMSHGVHQHGPLGREQIDGTSDLESDRVTCARGSWAALRKVPLDQTTFQVQYITSLYWAVTTTCSVGYGDITAKLVPEMVLALLCMVFGVVFYGYIIANVAASIAAADAQRARFQGRLDGIKRFLTDQEIDSNIKTRVMKYYDYLWLRTKGRDMENLFQGLSISLQGEITLSLYQEIIEAVPLFQGTEVGFMKMLSLYIKPLLILKKEYIVRKGDIGQEMYFIHSGVVEVCSEHETPIIFDTMGAGRFFGEISIIFSCPRTASIRAQTNCDLYVLTKKDLDAVLSNYPLIKKQIVATAEERQNMVKKRNEAALKKKQEEDRKKKEEEDRKRQEEEDKKAKEETEKDNQNNEEENKGSTTTPQSNAATAKDFPSDEVIVAVDENSIEIQTSKCCKTDLTLGQAWERLTKWNRFCIGPDSSLRYINQINCFLAFLTYLMITYMAAFQDHNTGLFIFCYLCEAFFLAEIYLNFHMAYFTENGEMVTDFEKLCRKYAKGKFGFDLVANFPIDLVALCFPANERLKILCYIRLLHILRIERIRLFYKELLNKLNINILAGRISENLFQLSICIHTFACIWYQVACPNNECNQNSWISQLKSTRPIDRYCDSLYWTVATMTSTGYGDLHPTNTSEMIFASFVMVWGKLLFGFVLGNVASTMASSEALQVKYEEKLSSIKAHMRDQHISQSLQKRVIDFFEYIWQRNRGLKSKGLFDDLPQCMLSELYMSLAGDLIKEIPFFKGCEPPFIRLLSTKVQLYQFHSGEYIMKEGDIAQELYIMKKGEALSVSSEGHKLAYTCGNYFGDEGLMVNGPCLQTIQALTHVDILVLKKQDLEDAFISFPEELDRVKESAKRIRGFSMFISRKKAEKE